MKWLNFNIRKPVITFIFTLICFQTVDVHAQYLRDNTQYINLEQIYPVNDTAIINEYLPGEKFQLTLDETFGMPEIIVEFETNEFPLILDFGNSHNITITNEIAGLVSHTVTDTSYTYTADGKIRGRTLNISIPEFIFLDSVFTNEEGVLMDWTITSTEPYNGLVGLKYLHNKCFTLSYKQKILAVSDRNPLPETCLEKATIIILENFRMHPHGIHFKGRVNDQEAIIYFDTGKSHTILSSELVPQDKIVSDKSGSFYAGTVEVSFGNLTFRIYFPRVKNIHRSIECDLPVGIEVGSDVLRYLLLTVDRSPGHNTLIIHH